MDELVTNVSLRILHERGFEIPRLYTFLSAEEYVDYLKETINLILQSLTTEDGILSNEAIIELTKLAIRNRDNEITTYLKAQRGIDGKKFYEWLSTMWIDKDDIHTIYRNDDIENQWASLEGE